MRSTLLTIGDFAMDEVKKAPSVNKFYHYRKSLIKRGMKFEFVTYDDLLLGRAPEVSAKKLKIMLFFPYAHWNSNIERYDKDDRIYGDENFGKDYKKFFLQVEKAIKNKYEGRKIEYVNSPQGCILDRDKRKTARVLRKNNILTPGVYKITSIRKLDKALDKVGALYVKPPFGAMGKGISFLTKRECWTNFIFKGGKIISRPYDYDWDFVRLSGKRRDSFLKILIKRKFIFEESITLPVVKKRKFDMRVYVIYGKIPYLYAKSAPRKNFVTNWSQGGRIEKKSFLKKIFIEEKINEIKRIAKKCSGVMGLNYTGIDIIPDAGFNKIYFLEAHAFPGYERGFNLMKFLIGKV